MIRLKRDEYLECLISSVYSVYVHTATPFATMLFQHRMCVQTVTAVCIGYNACAMQNDNGVKGGSIYPCVFFLINIFINILYNRHA